MEKIIGLMGAMREEIALLCERMTDKGEETVAGVTFYTGLLQGRRVALCCAGIGKVNAACAAQLLIARFGAKVLVFSGIAGNMTDKIGVGDVVIGGTLVYHDADREKAGPGRRRGVHPHLCQNRGGYRGLHARGEKGIPGGDGH